LVFEGLKTSRDPMHASVRPDYAPLTLLWFVCLKGTLAESHRLSAVLGMEQLLPRQLSPAEFAGLQAINSLHLWRPDIDPSLLVPLEDAQTRRRGRET